MDNATRTLSLLPPCVLCAALAACNGANCLITTTGDATASLECTAVATRDAETGTTTLVIAAVAAEGAPSYFNFAVELAGQASPSAITYTSTNTGKTLSWFGECSSGCFFQYSHQCTRTGDALQDMGAFSLAVSHVGAPVVANGSTSYFLSGTADLTMVPTFGGGAGVEAHISF